MTQQETLFLWYFGKDKNFGLKTAPDNFCRPFLLLHQNCPVYFTPPPFPVNGSDKNDRDPVRLRR